MKTLQNGLDIGVGVVKPGQMGTLKKRVGEMHYEISLAHQYVTP
jgi:hypothetical protein